jgi:short-subunit dehydrogenase
MDLREKVVLVTGASSGIGRELALQLAAKGARLGLVARRQELLDALAKEIGAQEAVAIKADVADRAQVEAAVAQVQGRFGRLDALVNDAGLGYFGSVEQMPTEDVERVFRVNVLGPLYAIKAALPHLKRSRGMIVNVSSGLSKRALPFLSAYAGTKAMLDALSDGMRLELKKHGVHVLTFCPPEVDTAFSDNALKHELAGRDAPGRKKAKAFDVARRLVKAMVREEREVVMNGGLAATDFFAPWLLDRIFYKAMVLKMNRD